MNIKKTIAFWDQVMTSITFAEANEQETARRIMEDRKNSGLSGNEENKEMTGASSLPPRCAA